MKRPIKLIIPIITALFIVSTSIAFHTEDETDVSEAVPIETPTCYSQHHLIHYASAMPIEFVTPSIEPVPEPEPEPAAYQEIADVITDEEIETLARLLYLEAGNQGIEGQRAVIEVVFNRVLSDEFPYTIDEVVYAENQFSPAYLIPSTTPTEVQYEVIQTVLTDTETVLDRGVVFFSRGQYNDYLYAKIGDHYFCYSTKSYNTMKGTEQ